MLCLINGGLYHFHSVTRLRLHRVSNRISHYSHSVDTLKVRRAVGAQSLIPLLGWQALMSSQVKVRQLYSSARRVDQPALTQSRVKVRRLYSGEKQTDRPVLTLLLVRMPMQHTHLAQLRFTTPQQGLPVHIQSQDRVQRLYLHAKQADRPAPIQSLVRVPLASMEGLHKGTQDRIRLQDTRQAVFMSQEPDDPLSRVVRSNSALSRHIEQGSSIGTVHHGLPEHCSDGMAVLGLPPLLNTGTGAHGYDA
jgi:hypothetical protein